jgi:hypothetical protein
LAIDSGRVVTDTSEAVPNPFQLPGANDMRANLYTLLDKYFDRFAFAFALFACSFFALHAIALIVSVILGLSLR